MLKDDLLKIINHFGIDNQQRKLQEEIFELQEAITKHELQGCEYEHIIEEMADCFNIMCQILCYYDIDDEELNNMITNKIKRTIERMESGYYDRKN